MDKLLQRFLTKIGIFDVDSYNSGSFLSLNNDQENNRIVGVLKFDSYLTIDAYQELFDAMKNFTQLGGFKIELTFKYSNEKDSIRRLLDSYRQINKLDFLYDADIYDKDKQIVFNYYSNELYSDVYQQVSEFRQFLDSISSSYNTVIKSQVKFDDEEIKNNETRYQKQADNYATEMEKNRALNETYQVCSLKDVEKFNKVIVSGKIFKLCEDRKTKNNNIIRKIEFSDGTDSISTTLFESKEFTRDKIDEYKVGTKIKVTGSVYRDKFDHNELSIKKESIDILPPDPERVDDYPRKRVELHLHTKFSSFDGVSSIEDYIKTAKSFSHPAIAITDHGVCQGFPDAQQAANNAGIKMLYGCEFYMVDDKQEDMIYVYNPKGVNLSDTTYVVFDTETTGLSCRYDRLIEFGAVKIDKNGQVLDRMDFFINPDMEISGFAVEKSHITQQMVDSGKSIKNALQTIKEFFSDCVLVAHNASFDFDFLNEAFKNNDMEKLQNPCIDTLAIARYLYPDMRSHREEVLARKFRVDFDSLNAHRADYDAEKLSEIFQCLLSDLKIKTNNSQLKDTDLVNLEVSKDMFINFHPSHVVALVKNMDGLKDLYRLISYSSTDYLSRNGIPILPKSLLEKYRENLLLGSACLNGEVFEAAMTKGKEKLIDKMKFYDYIEVQPPENYSFLINDSQLRSFDEITKILKDIIDCAKSINKIVVATGDCHYINPEDKIYRDVYISAGGVKGARHPLNLAPRDNESEQVKQKWYNHPLENPNQHFRTTKEMIDAFSFLNDEKLIEEIVIDNTNYIADQISEVKPTKTGLYPPYIPGADQMLSDLAYKTAKEIYGDPLPEIINDRLKVELDGIIKNGYSVIYWLSSDIVRWCNDQGYLIGSRGSVGSSLVATMTGITEVNPLPPHYRCPHCHHLEWADVSKYQSGFDLPEKKCPECGATLIGDGQNIPFATFLGFHAEKVPDIDLNFPSDFQAKAHEHMREVLNKTGNVCYKAGTIQTCQEKQARGYVLGYFESLGRETNKIRSAEIDRIAAGCIDVKRSTGQHPGGVIVIPKGMEVYDFTPVQYPADDTDASWKTTHYDFHKIHDNVLKFDMLGHIDPQAIRMQCDLCGFSFKDMKEKIPISDPEAHSLFWSNKALHLKRNVLQQQTGALGLPEFGTENGRRVLLETKPSSFADLVRISGLSHGTDVFAGNAEKLIVDEGMKLSDVIACRDDIMTVLMEKYNLDSSDAFNIMEFTRKGKFAKPGSQDLKELYEKILVDHNVPRWYIDSCKKIMYMFPKAHAVAYVTNCIRCAWFKVHQPLSYYATYFSLRCDQYDITTQMAGIDACVRKRNQILTKKMNKEDVSAAEESLLLTLESTIEMYDRGYNVLPISILRSPATTYGIDKSQNGVIPSLISIPSLGAAQANVIVQARNEKQFTSIEDLKKRGKVSDSMIAKLKAVGCLDGLDETAQISLF